MQKADDFRTALQGCYAEMQGGGGGVLRQMESAEWPQTDSSWRSEIDFN